MILDDHHQEAGGRGKGGSEVGAWEGSADPGAGSVCARAPVQDLPTGGCTTAAQVKKADCASIYTPFAYVICWVEIRCATADILSYNQSDLECGKREVVGLHHCQTVRSRAEWDCKKEGLFCSCSSLIVP